MHFIDRENAPKSAQNLLLKSNQKYKDKWKEYNTAKKDNKKLPSKPPSLWNDNIIRDELKTKFLKNCGYCGIHTDRGFEAEVDHFFPVSEDLDADFIYDWENYIWSCPSCNRKKSNNYPVLNPCSEEEMNQLYFHSADGRYLPFDSSNDDIKQKFLNTETHTFINGKNRPERREYMYRDVLENHLSRIQIAFLLYEAEIEVKGADSIDAKKKLDLYKLKKQNFFKLIRCGDFLKLINQIVVDYTNENNNFPFTFEDAIIESGFLEN